MLKVQEYLKSGKTLVDLETEYGIQNTILNSKVSLNYDMISSPLHEKICQECRGLILRENTWDIVAYPFDKFFNIQEGNAAKVDWSSAKVIEKLDGSLIIFYFDDILDKWCFATRSMPEADGIANGVKFSDLARTCLYEMGISYKEFTQKLNQRYTYLFEMTTPLNQIVVRHEQYKLTLIGVRDIDSLQELDPATIDIGISVPQTFSFSSLEELNEYINKWSPIDHEGVVVVDNKFRRVKIKSIAYVTAHGTISSLSASDRNIMRLIIMNAHDDVLSLMPKVLQDKTISFVDKLAKLVETIQKEYDSIKHIDDMKEFARLALKSTWDSPLFALKRNKVNSIGDYLDRQRSDSAIDRILDLIKEV